MLLEEIKNKFPEVWLNARRAFPALSDNDLVAIINFAHEISNQELFSEETPNDGLFATA